MFFLVLLQAQIDGKVVQAKFTLPERKKVSSPPKAVVTASRRDAPKTDSRGADIEKDGQKRQRDCELFLVIISNETVEIQLLDTIFIANFLLSASPRRKPLSPLRRRSPLGRRGSPRRELDSPVHRRIDSPNRRGDSPPPRRRPASPARGRSPSSPPRRYNRSPPRLVTAV